MGTLDIFPANERTDLLAPPVVQALGTIADASSIGVAEIDPALSDTAAFCEKYQVNLSQAANCIVLEAKGNPEKSGDLGVKRTWYAACVVLGTTRADVNNVARKALDARRVSFAPMEQAVSLTAMEYGAITPIGLPADWPILIDKAVADSELLIIGSGVRKSKLVVSGKVLAELPNVQILEGLGRPHLDTAN